MLQNHKELSKLDSNKTQMYFNANNLYPSATWNQNSVYTKIESGFCFRPDTNDVHVEAFNNQTFNEDDNESAMLKLKFYNPPNFMG